MTKVLFVYPNPAMDNLIPISISLLSSCVKEHGHQTALFDTTFYGGKPRGDFYRERNLQVKKTQFKKIGITRKENMIGDFRKLVRDFNPDLIALSVLEFSYRRGVEVLESVKDLGIKTIVGGVFATFSPEDVIRESCVDMVCVGEGEDALVELCNSLRDGKDITKIRNLWVKNRKTGEVHKNELRPLKNLDDLPFQDWTIFDKQRLYKPMFGKFHVAGAFESTRGCVYNCGFCCNPAFRKLYGGKGRFYREKDIKKVVDEIIYFKENYGLQILKFVDASFLYMEDKRFYKFIELYRDVRVPFWTQVRAETITEERVALLEEVGCMGLEIGIESGSQKIRNIVVGKALSEQKIIDAFEIMKKHKKVKVWSSNIIGFPHETRKDIFDTIELNRKINPPSCSVNLFAPYRGTKLHEVCIKEGYMGPDTLVGDYRGEYCLDMPQITKEELFGLQRTFLMYLRFPKKMWAEIKKAETDDKVFEKLSKIYSEKYLSPGQTKEEN